MSDEFDWTKDDSVVIKRRDAIAVYLNEAGGVTIRREGHSLQEGDPIIVVQLEDVPKLIAALQRIQVEAGEKK